MSSTFLEELYALVREHKDDPGAIEDVRQFILDFIDEIDLSKSAKRPKILSPESDAFKQTAESIRADYKACTESGVWMDLPSYFECGCTPSVDDVKSPGWRAAADFRGDIAYEMNELFLKWYNPNADDENSDIDNKEEQEEDKNLYKTRQRVIHCAMQILYHISSISFTVISDDENEKILKANVEIASIGFSRVFAYSVNHYDSMLQYAQKSMNKIDRDSEITKSHQSLLDGNMTLEAFYEKHPKFPKDIDVAYFDAAYEFVVFAIDYYFGYNSNMD